MWWASVSANPRELKALTEAALAAAAALSALLFQPREHHDRRRRFQFTVRTQNKVSNLERRVRTEKTRPRVFSGWRLKATFFGGKKLTTYFFISLKLNLFS